MRGKESRWEQRVMVVGVGRLLFLALVPQPDAICLQMLLKIIDGNPHTSQLHFLFSPVWL